MTYRDSARRPVRWLLAGNIPSAVALASSLVSMMTTLIGIQLHQGAERTEALIWAALIFDVLIIIYLVVTVAVLRRHPQWVERADRPVDQVKPLKTWLAASTSGVLSLILLIPMVFVETGSAYLLIQAGSGLLAAGLFMFLSNRESKNSFLK